MYVPTVFVLIYVKRRRVDPRVARWGPSNVLRGALPVIPYVAFILGAFRAYDGTGGHSFGGAALGMVIGLALAIVVLAVSARMRRRREAMAVRDED
jgi:hypothetical protein